MSNIQDFKAGDRVTHLMLGDGKVTEADESHVRVAFKSKLSGKPAVGVYDRKWFALNPTYLFHRTAKT